jgi:superfamily II DNA/RNA helicase
LNFRDFSFEPQIAAGIAAAGYTAPTPIQTQAILPVMKGRDLMGLAQTGTGKTAAFVLPILQRLLHGRPGSLRALIIAPTRELAEQIHEAIGTLGGQTGLRSVTVYGGVGIQPQIQKLKQADIAVACPGRLLDHIGRRTVDLSRLEVLVLDEADQMFDMGFLPDIRRIMKHLPQANRQTLLFSATMSGQIRRLAQDILKRPMKVQVGHNAPVATVSHAFYPVPQHLKTALLFRLLDSTETESVLVFTRTKHRARQLGGKLAKAGYCSTSLQGNLSQSRRRNAMNGFKSGKYQVLVATDIAARGIDVSNVSHVINFDMPATTETYIHRIGRTGRAQRSGQAYTLVTDQDGQMVRAIHRAMGSPVEQRTIEDFNYQVSGAPRSLRNQSPATPMKHRRRRRKVKRRTGEGAFVTLSPHKIKKALKPAYSAA